MFKSEHFVNGFISISLTHSTNYLLILCWEWNWGRGCQEEESVHLCLPWSCLQLSVGHTCRLQAYNSMVTACGVVGESLLSLWTSEHGLRMGKELFTGNLLVDQDFLRSVIWRRHSCCGSSMVSTGKRKAQPKSWELLFFFSFVVIVFKITILIFKVLKIYLLIFGHHMACKILVPQPGIKPAPSGAEVQSRNCWTTREVWGLCFIWQTYWGLEPGRQPLR